MKVVFNDVSEYLHELELNASGRPSRGIEPDRIVRLTTLRVVHSESPLATISVVSTFCLDGEPETVVELKARAGEVFRHEKDESTEKVWSKAKEIHGQIEAKCKELHLEVRAGCYRP